MLWEVDIYPAEGEPDLPARRIAADAADLGLGHQLHVSAARGYLIQGRFDRSQVCRLAAELLSDPVVERAVVGPAGDPELAAPPRPGSRLIHVLPKPGVMDPVAQSALAAMGGLQPPADAVRTLAKYWVAGLADDKLPLLA